MKKIILIALLLMSYSNVTAKTEYTDYKLVGYTEEKREDTDLVKYELTQLNKFYREIETNIMYLERDINIGSCPYIDETDYRIQKDYDKYRMFENGEYHVVSIKSFDNYKTDVIYIDNFDTGYEENKVFEIEIYDKEQKIEYKIDKLEWLNDGIKDKGKFLKGETFKLSLDGEYEIENLKLVIYYNYNMGYESKFDIGFRNNYYDTFRETVKLDAYLDDAKITVIDVIDEDTFDSFMPRYSILTFYDVDIYTQASYYAVQKTLYKHYNLEREYFITTELDYVVGYIYDESESIPVYKILKRELVEVDENEKGDNTDEKNDIDKKGEETNPDIVIPEETLEQEKNTDKETPKEEIIKNEFVSCDKLYNSSSTTNVKNTNTTKKYPASLDTSKDATGEKIDTDLIEIETENSSNDCNCKEEDKTFTIKEFLLKSILISLMILIFTQIIHLIKCKV